MRKISLILVCWAFGLAAVRAQNSTVLENYVQEAFSNNLALKQQLTDLDKAQMAIRQSKALFYPKLTFDANYTVAGGGRRIDFPIGDLLNPVYGTLNQLTQSNAFPSLENQQIQFLPNNFHETKVSFSVPLYNTDLKYNRKIQEKRFSTHAKQIEAYRQDLRQQVTESYLNYAKAVEAQKIWENALVTLHELLRFNESLVKNNVATRDVVATAQYEIVKADHEVFALQSTQNTAKAYFNFLLNRDLRTEVVVDTAFFQAIQPRALGDSTFAQAMRYDLGGRKEVDVLNLARAAAQMNVTRNELNQKMPDFYLGGSFGFQGFGYKFNKEQAYALAQVGLTYDLYDGGLQRSKTQEARLDVIKIEQQKMEVQQQLRLQAIAAKNDFDTAYDLYTSNQMAVRTATTIFNIVGNKYRAGQALLLEYIDAQNRVTQARLQQALSWNDVLLKASALRRAAGVD